MIQHRAWGLETPRDDGDWLKRAACRADPDRWHGQGFGSVWEAQRSAAHICLNHCPVRVACRAAAERHTPDGCVQGGVLWTSGSLGRPVRLSDKQPARIGCDGVVCDPTRLFGTTADRTHRGPVPKPAEDCGSMNAARRHRRHHEPVDTACLRAEAEYTRQIRLRKKAAAAA